MEAFASLLVDVKSLESSLPKNGFSLEWCSQATYVLRKMHSHFKFLIINKKLIKVPKFYNDKNYYEEYSNECENLMEFCKMIKLAISRMDIYHLMVELAIRRFCDEGSLSTVAMKMDEIKRLENEHVMFYGSKNWKYQYHLDFPESKKRPKNTWCHSGYEKYHGITFPTHS
ncbi:hypothetical protein Tsubulata_018207 [Turnera subulata]|uniref:Uncharacterized protein n=1 Tax=Turnera subulata TaxID=218843 RepID=A0A9Q0F8R6_9ROSI|nr:hypothetical protein Tsubulata_018207 [Turnera subulata]